MELRDAGCDHPAMRDGTCLDCGDACTCRDPEQPWAGDHDCPIHGEAS